MVTALIRTPQEEDFPAIGGSPSGGFLSRLPANIAVKMKLCSVSSITRIVRQHSSFSYPGASGSGTVMEDACVSLVIVKEDDCAVGRVPP